MIKLWIKVRLYLLVISAAIAVLTIAYTGWKYQVEQAALVKWNARQTEILLQAQQKYAQDREELLKSVEAITADLHKKMEDLETSTKEITDQLNSPKAVEDEKKSGLSSEVLRDTVKRLGRQK